MGEIEFKILQIVQEQIFKSVFQAVAPNYTDQTEVALEHVYQIVTDKDGNKSCCSVQEYYTQILAAMQSTYFISGGKSEGCALASTCRGTH